MKRVIMHCKKEPENGDNDKDQSVYASMEKNVW